MCSTFVEHMWIRLIGLSLRPFATRRFTGSIPLAPLTSFQPFTATGNCGCFSEVAIERFDPLYLFGFSDASSSANCFGSVMSPFSL